MTREQVSKIIDGITDEQITKLLDLNSSDIGKAKGDFADVKSQLNAANEQISAMKETIAELEKAKDNQAALQAEIDKYKKMEEDRAEAERQAAADKAIADRFNAVSSDAKFVNDITQKGILAEFKAALLADENKGKGDKDIYEALTKDRDGIFANPNPPADIPGSGNVNMNAVDDAEIRKVMGLPIK